MAIIPKAVLLATPIIASQALATGHFSHESGSSGDWTWKDVQGMYSALTNGKTPVKEYLVVFCTDPDSRGGISLTVGLNGDQVGDHRATFRFSSGASIDVIANYGNVTAKSAKGQEIIGSILSELRSGDSVKVVQKGLPVAEFSLRGSSAVLKRCS